MALADRAENIIPLLRSESRLQDGDVFFVAHSFGGLVIEQVLRSLDAKRNEDPEGASLLRRVRRVAFLGTPHYGADLATWAGALRVVALPSAAVRGLARNDPNLRDLNRWYRSYASANGIETLVLSETRRTGLLGYVVKPDSADPGLPSTPIPVDADHYSICSPADRNSEIFIHIRDFLRAPIITAHQETLVAGQLSRNTESVNAMAASIERLSEVVPRSASAARVPSGIIDAEIHRRLERMRKSRFFGGYEPIEHARRLAHDIMDGDLVAGSANEKSRALAWCARLLYGGKNGSEAAKVLEAARALASTTEVTIGEAFRKAFEGDPAGALATLSGIDAAQSRTAAFIIVSNEGIAADPIGWLRDAGLDATSLDPDGKLFLLRQEMKVGRWDEALEIATHLREEDYEHTPALFHAAAGAHLGQAVPEELKLFAIDHFPFNPEQFPLADDSNALAHRRAAQRLYAQAADAASSLGCEQASYMASDHALWLSLRDPVGRVTARTTLEQSMRQPVHGLRRLPLALRFGLKLDLNAVEQEIDRQTTLSGGNSPDAAVARFALAFTKKEPREVADYIERHREQLTKRTPICSHLSRFRSLLRRGNFNKRKSS
jgi:hypothetical protein